jgi:hypothetical protein
MKRFGKLTRGDKESGLELVTHLNGESILMYLSFLIKIKIDSIFSSPRRNGKTSLEHRSLGLYASIRYR